MESIYSELHLDHLLFPPLLSFLLKLSRLVERNFITFPGGVFLLLIVKARSVSFVSRYRSRSTRLPASVPLPSASSWEELSVGAFASSSLAADSSMEPGPYYEPSSSPQHEFR